VLLRRTRNLITDVEAALERREFQRIYQQTWADVFRYALVLCRHREDAEDVA
jgi:DNA-directed RNA polymerase specialized sigma24 family protein